MNKNDKLRTAVYNTPAQDLAGDIYWQVWLPDDSEEGISSLAVATHAKISVPVFNASFMDFDNFMQNLIEKPRHVRN
jgi:hypothetical protein